MSLRWTEEDLKRIQGRRIDWIDSPAYRRNQEMLDARTAALVKQLETLPARPSVFPLSLKLRLHSIANERIHYMARHRHMKAHRMAVLDAIAGRQMPALPLTVTIVRIGPRKLDTDNLAIACKGVRDGLAQAWGVDDGSDLYDWRYAQESAGTGVYGVRIEIAPRGELRVTPV